MKGGETLLTHVKEVPYTRNIAQVQISVTSMPRKTYRYVRSKRGYTTLSLSSKTEVHEL